MYKVETAIIFFLITPGYQIKELGELDAQSVVVDMRVDIRPPLYITLYLVRNSFQFFDVFEYL